MDDLNFNQPGIYRIANTVNGKSYIGSAVNLRKRWIEHRRRLRKGDHHSPALQAAWGKYGEKMFVFSVLEVISDRTLLIDREQFWMGQLLTSGGYNICPIAGNTLGRKMTEETKRKISLAKTGKPNGQLGMKRTPEQVERIAKGQIGKQMPPEAIAKTRAAHIGRKNSPETIARMRIANKLRRDRERAERLKQLEI